MCHTHCTTDKPDAELCDDVSQDHSWSNTARRDEKYDNPQVGQAAKDIIRRLYFMECMNDMCVLKKLLVCAPEHGK